MSQNVPKSYADDRDSRKGSPDYSLEEICSEVEAKKIKTPTYTTVTHVQTGYTQNRGNEEGGSKLLSQSSSASLYVKGRKGKAVKATDRQSNQNSHSRHSKNTSPVMIVPKLLHAQEVTSPASSQGHTQKKTLQFPKVASQLTARGNGEDIGIKGEPRGARVRESTVGISSQRIVRPILYFIIAVLCISIANEVSKLLTVASPSAMGNGKGSKSGSEKKSATSDKFFMSEFQKKSLEGSDEESSTRRQERNSENRGPPRKRSLDFENSDASKREDGKAQKSRARKHPFVEKDYVVPLPLIRNYSRAEILSAVLPIKDITLVPSIFQKFKELVYMNLFGEDSSSTQEREEKAGENVRRRAEPSVGEAFPRQSLPFTPWIQITDNKMVSSRGAKLSSYYKCFGAHRPDTPSLEIGNASSPSSLTLRQQVKRTPTLDDTFDFAFFPVGCFGDPIPKTSNPNQPVDCAASRSPSCKLGPIMSKMASCASKVFGAFLGDNFYPNGIEKRGSDRRIEEEIPEKFTKYPLLGKSAFPQTMAPTAEKEEKKEPPTQKFLTEDDGTAVRWYATVGNHDLKPRYQFRYDNPYWIMPDVRHVSPIMRSALTASTTTVQLFLFSTQWGYDRNDPHMEGEAQWLDQQLSTSTADWKIVGTHEQIFGFMAFEHGSGLVKYIHPVLVKHNVRIFVCAHQHSVQSFLTNGNYFHVTSAGFAEGSINYAAKPRRPPGYFHGASGAVAILLNKDDGHIVSFDENENIIFAHKIYREVGGGPIVDVVEAASKEKGVAAKASSGGDGVTAAGGSKSRKHLLELEAYGVDQEDPMWRVSTVRKCDRFKIKDSFQSAAAWDKSDSECWMYV